MPFFLTTLDSFSTTQGVNQQDDAFSTSVRNAFLRLSSNPRVFWGLLTAVAIAFVAAMGSIIYNENRTENSQRALFDAQRKNTPVPAPSGSPAADAVAPFDAEALGKVATQHSGTIAGFQAAMVVAKHYLEAGNSTEAIRFYELASKSAKETVEKGAVYFGWGVALENARQFDQAALQFERAVNTGEPAFKGLALLGWARSKVQTQDTKKAKEVYERIARELPNTADAQTAEMEKSKLGS